jgi:hypothetical protein
MGVAVHLTVTGDLAGTIDGESLAVASARKRSERDDTLALGVAEGQDVAIGVGAVPDNLIGTVNRGGGGRLTP